MSKLYMVYGKQRSNGKSNKFHPVDMKNNKLVINKINGSLFDERQLPKLKEEVRQMNLLNDQYVFEIRIQQ